MAMERLFEMVYLLMERPSITAKELAERFEVSTRTVLRDVDTLSKAGVPIYTIQGRGGGIALMEGYVLNKFLLTEGEQQEVLFALKALTAVKAMDTQGTLDKVQTLFQKHNTDWIQVDFSPWGTGPKEKEKWQLVKEAVLHKRLLAFDYYNRYGQKNHRLIEPGRVVYKAHSWYIQGYCTKKKDWRIYKLSRMKNLEIQEETFTRLLPLGLPFDENDGTGPQGTFIKLKFSPRVAWRVYDEFEEENITALEDGGFIATAYYPYDDWVVGHVLSFGRDVTVLAPDFLQADVIRQGEEILRNYGKI